MTRREQVLAYGCAAWLNQWLRAHRGVNLSQATEDDLNALIEHLIDDEEKRGEEFSRQWGDLAPGQPHAPFSA